jgi:hypothetical protein
MSGEFRIYMRHKPPYLCFAVPHLPSSFWDNTKLFKEKKLPSCHFSTRPLFGKFVIGVQCLAIIAPKEVF